jgi:hypothetical protein
MPATVVNLNGINELDLALAGTVTATTAAGVTTITQTGISNNTHDEPLTDGNANFIFAATLTTGGDIIVVIDVPN